MTESDREAIVAAVLETLGGQPISGYIDENNNIIVQGNLTNGTYCVKYETDNGVIDIGELKFSYTVTNNLTNCTNSNAATSIANGEEYSATITANSGYELSSVAVTMGGTPVAVSGGTISIARVTGDLVITAVAEAVGVATNFAQPLTVGRLSNSAAGNISTDASRVRTTNFIEVQNGDIFKVQGFDPNESAYAYYMVFNSSKVKVGVLMEQSVSNDYVTVNANEGTFTITSDSIAYIRFCGIPSGAESDVTVNIKRSGEWL